MFHLRTPQEVDRYRHLGVILEPTQTAREWLKNGGYIYSNEPKFWQVKPGQDLPRLPVSHMA